jgi:hypothetical protein
MPEQIGEFFPTQVPEYTEAADIRKAFNLYHYGSESVPTTLDQVLPESMAGYIRDTLQAVANIEAGISTVNNLGLNQNLNSVTTTGLYSSSASPNLSLNYPVATIGYLNVVFSNNQVYQTYQTTSGLNNFYWRSGTLSGSSFVWGEWSLSSKLGHNHDDRYNTKSEISARLNTIPAGNAGAMTPSRAAIVDANGRVTSSTGITVNDLNSLSGMASGTSMTIAEQLSDKAPSTHNHDDLYYTKSQTPRIWVQSTQPSSPSPNDLWVW